jgi:hypothetical protein
MGMGYIVVATVAGRIVLQAFTTKDWQKLLYVKESSRIKQDA